MVSLWLLTVNLILPTALSTMSSRTRKYHGPRHTQTAEAMFVKSIETCSHYLLIISFKNYIYLLCESLFCLYVCMDPVLGTFGALRGQIRVSDPLELELQTFSGHHVGAGNQAQVLHKSHKCS